MKKLKELLKYPLLLTIIISSLLFSIIGYVGKSTIYKNYSSATLKTPQLAAVFEGIEEGKYPWNMGDKKSKHEKHNSMDPEYDVRDDDSTQNKDGSEQATGNDMVDRSASNNNEKTNDSVDSGEKIHSVDASKDSKDKVSHNNLIDKEKSTSKADNKNKEKEVKGKEKQAKNNLTDKGKTSKNKASAKVLKADTKGEKKDSSAAVAKKDSNKDSTKVINQDTKKDSKNDIGHDTKQNTNQDTKQDVKQYTKKEEAQSEDNSKTYSFQSVPKSYFDDALFIGDSRTVGLSEYSGWKKPTYFANVGLTIYDVMDKKVAKLNGQQMTIGRALTKKSFKKIYIMLGINELGRGTAKSFAEEYKKVIGKIHELQPNSIIYIQAIMNVTKKKSDTDPIFNNKNIRTRNEHIKKLANNKNIFYIDVNEAITDRTGGIPQKYTFDNIHLKAAYYKIWTKFLMKHGIVVK
ncbi:GDSL-type esterase/lipase family protein [Anaeromicropila herbilytica]|uniref:SGNH hydrolase-type esterase domain-containing protein n=1 Tax=Anaeromicropila herbilytica TaxID=2785025 RepID=A0A7R7EHK0_9FIRM|nr:GDSL-type esterase/lipase family protein [Anaeromicropila herbilytica]BCN28829.1 hypothetical protein bsdtb5_01240 [Anaeromicropila herbilytica]